MTTYLPASSDCPTDKPSAPILLKRAAHDLDHDVAPGDAVQGRRVRPDRGGQQPQVVDGGPDLVRRAGPRQDRRRHDTQYQVTHSSPDAHQQNAPDRVGSERLGLTLGTMRQPVRSLTLVVVVAPTTKVDIGSTAVEKEVVDTGLVHHGRLCGRA